jgi:hypothetical protein
VSAEPAGTAEGSVLIAANPEDPRFKALPGDNGDLMKILRDTVVMYSESSARTGASFAVAFSKAISPAALVTKMASSRASKIASNKAHRALTCRSRALRPPAALGEAGDKCVVERP